MCSATTGGEFYTAPSSSTNSSTAKTFIIDHPVDTNRYLVHGCLEGPETGVYYRGKAKIVCDNVVVRLPSYVKHLAFDFTVHLTSIGKNNGLYCSEVENGQFTVYGDSGEFYWIVHGSRMEINPEPCKETISVHGDGPYRWCENKS